MRNALPLLALVLALPASAQFAGTDAEELAAAARRAAAMREKLRPAAVERAPVEALFSKLADEGDQIEVENGIGNVLTRMGKPDAGGRFRNVQATLVEIPAEAAEEPSDSMMRHAVMRRYFSHLEASSESWSAGRVDIWRWTVGLDGTLIAVEHQIVPVEGGEPVEAKLRAYRMSPSDPSVQRRWKSLSKELLTLGKLIEA
ncbi:MAG: hypothetical protein M0D55_04740 [Elusimicrobiota bacterium]|nr:MAG: hypothetical protein M0D55_04740 [Elusimicrobiota bacterium]